MALMDASTTAADTWQTLADHLPHLMWLADRNGALYWHNQRWRDYIGHGLGASQGWNWLQFVDGQHAERAESGLRRAIAAGEDWQDTLPLRRADGAYHWFLCRAVAIKDGEGCIAQWCVTNTDVTDRVGVEQELRDAARRKDAVLAWLGHELRNPLTPILTSAHVLMIAGPGDPALQTARETIVRQALQLSNLVDDILDAGRLSFGKLRLRRQRVELAPLIAQAVEACQGSIDQRRHRMMVTVPDAPLWLDADPTRVVQMISNLVTNAAKYMRDGGTIRISAAVDGRCARLRVADEGIGIAPDLLARIFEPYVQVGVGPLHTQGLGIGLALVKAIAGAHGGSVEARSDGLDRGSEFIVTLPLNDAGPDRSLL